MAILFSDDECEYVVTALALKLITIPKSARTMARKRISTPPLPHP